MKTEEQFIVCYNEFFNHELETINEWLDKDFIEDKGWDLPKKGETFDEYHNRIGDDDILPGDEPEMSDEAEEAHDFLDDENEFSDYVREHARWDGEGWDLSKEDWHHCEARARGDYESWKKERLSDWMEQMAEELHDCAVKFVEDYIDENSDEYDIDDLDAEEIADKTGYSLEDCRAAVSENWVTDEWLEDEQSSNESYKDYLLRNYGDCAYSEGFEEVDKILAEHAKEA